MENVVTQAIEKMGGLTAFAAALGVKPPSVVKWRTRGYIPAARVMAVERLTKIPRHELNPVIFAEVQAAA